VSLIHKQHVTEAPKSLPAFRYMSFDVVGTLIDFESAIKDGMAKRNPRQNNRRA
jgi:FMN phosphatase YigB (HAD superfamily)